MAIITQFEYTGNSLFRGRAGSSWKTRSVRFQGPCGRACGVHRSGRFHWAGHVVAVGSSVRVRVRSSTRPRRTHQSTASIFLRPSPSRPDPLRRALRSKTAAGRPSRCSCCCRRAEFPDARQSRAAAPARAARAPRRDRRSRADDRRDSRAAAPGCTCDRSAEIAAVARGNGPPAGAPCRLSTLYMESPRLILFCSGRPSAIRFGTIPRRIHQTFRRESRPRAGLANGSPLSLRIRSGNP